MTIYIALLRGIIRNSKLANNLQKLEVPATVRNWKTINKIAALTKPESFDLETERSNLLLPNIDHISITVGNLNRAEEFYDQFLPIIGFNIRQKAHDAVPEHSYEVVEYYSTPFTFCLVKPRKEYLDDQLSRRRPGALHHLAFRAESKEAVDNAFLQVQDISAQVIYPPQLWPEYCDTYYAFFLKDSEGIELEIVYYIRE